MIDGSCICKFNNVLVMKDTLNQVLLSKVCRTAVWVLLLSHMIRFLCKRKLNIDLCSKQPP
jgi:hypothetical protein